MQMVIPKSIRHQLLMHEWDYSSDSITKAAKATHKLHRQRHVTAMTSDNVFKAEEILQRVARKIRKIFVRRRSSSSSTVLEVHGAGEGSNVDSDDFENDEAKSTTSSVDMDTVKLLVDCGGKPQILQET